MSGDVLLSIEEIRFQREDRLSQYCGMIFDQFDWTKCARKLAKLGFKGVDWEKVIRGDAHLTSDQAVLFYQAALPKFSRRKKHFKDFFSVNDCPTADIFCATPSTENELSLPSMVETLPEDGSKLPPAETPERQQVRRRGRPKKQADPALALLPFIRQTPLMELPEEKLLVVCSGSRGYHPPILLDVPDGTVDVELQLLFLGVRPEIPPVEPSPVAPQALEPDVNTSLELVHRRALFFLVFLSSKSGGQAAVEFEKFTDDSLLDIAYSEITGVGEPMAQAIRLGAKGADQEQIRTISERFDSWVNQSEGTRLRCSTLAPGIDPTFEQLGSAPLRDVVWPRAAHGESALRPDSEAAKTRHFDRTKLAECLQLVSDVGRLGRSILSENGKKGISVTFHFAEAEPETRILDLPNDIQSIGYAFASKVQPTTPSSSIA